MLDLQFRCFQCGQMSPMNLDAADRGEVHRWNRDPSTSREVTFYCTACGAANAVPLTAEMMTGLLHRVSSNDPQIQRGIDAARRGDYDSAIDAARRRFGF